MNSRNIKAHLRRKVDDWAASVTDPVVAALILRDTIVTGGSIASLLLNEDVRDYDVYFTSQTTTLAVARYYLAQFKPKHSAGIPCKISVMSMPDIRGVICAKIVVKSAGIASEQGTVKPYQYFEQGPDGRAGQYLDDVIQDPEQIEEVYEETETMALAVRGSRTAKTKYRPVFISTNAITLSDKIQAVLRFSGNPEEIHSTFDFAHCMNYYRRDQDQLVLRPQALEALLTKELRYVGSLYPICSLIRLRKFIKRDWWISAGQVLKMVMQAAALDLTNPRVLEDQLTGVDCAYFAELLARVADKDPQRIDSAYLVEVIDKMF